MAGSVLILTAITREAAALRRVGLHAVPVGIRATRLPSVTVPPETKWIILAGVAGGLDPSLCIGEVVIDGPPALIPRGIQRRSIHTSPRLAATVAEKAALFTATAAAAVDMEQSIVAAWAEFRGLPLIGIRSISDTAAHSVHPSVLKFVNDIGRVRLLATAMGIARRPRLIRQLMRLNRGTHTALTSLAAATKQMVDFLENA